MRRFYPLLLALSSCFALRPFALTSPPQDPPDSLVTVSASFAPTQAPADGNTDIEVTLIARSGEAPLAQVSLLVAVGGSGNTVSGSGLTTDDEGVASFRVRSTIAEVKGLQARLDELTYDLGELLFVPGPLVTPSLVCASDLARADGVSALGCSLRAVDAFGNPISNLIFNIALTGTGNTVPSAVASDATGAVAFNVISNVAERKVLSASAGDMSSSTKLRFIGPWISALGDGVASLAAAPASDDQLWVAGAVSVARLDLSSGSFSDFSEGIPLDEEIRSAGFADSNGGSTRLFVALTDGRVLTRRTSLDAAFSELVRAKDPFSGLPSVGLVEDDTHVWILADDAIPVTAMTTTPAPVQRASRQSNGSWQISDQIAGLPVGTRIKQIVTTAAGKRFALGTTTGSVVYAWDSMSQVWSSFSTGQACAVTNSALSVDDATSPPTLYLACNDAPSLNRLLRSPSDSASWSVDTNFSTAILPTLATSSQIASLHVPADGSTKLLVLAGLPGETRSVYSRILPGGFLLEGSTTLDRLSSVKRGAGGRTIVAFGDSTQARASLETVTANASTALTTGLEGSAQATFSTSDGVVYVRTSSGLFAGDANFHWTSEPLGTFGQPSAHATDGNDIYLGSTGQGILRRRNGIWSSCSVGLADASTPTQIPPVLSLLVADLPGIGKRVIAGLSGSNSFGINPERDGVYFLDPAEPSCTWAPSVATDAPPLRVNHLSFGGGKLFASGREASPGFPPELVYVFASGAWTKHDPVEGTFIQGIAASGDGSLFVSFTDSSPSLVVRYASLGDAGVPVMGPSGVVPGGVIGLRKASNGDLYALTSRTDTSRILGFRLKVSELTSATPRMTALTIDGTASSGTIVSRDFETVGNRLYVAFDRQLCLSVSDGL